MSYCSLRLYTDYHGFISVFVLQSSNPHRDASTTGSHISSFRSLRWSAWLCRKMTAKGWWKKGFLVSFFSATENPTSWMFPKRSKRFCLCAWLQGPKGRGTNSFSWSLWHFSPRLCIEEHDSGEPAKIIKNGRCKNRTRTGFRFPCEGRGNEF